mmetsp:Transcript_66246/g.130517  ORF Transcript_66246/g.130517 Transcript_66246/m.130517 type:complete len:249 (+) Transcript_66246:76-822(+)
MGPPGLIETEAELTRGFASVNRWLMLRNGERLLLSGPEVEMILRRAEPRDAGALADILGSQVQAEHELDAALEQLHIFDEHPAADVVQGREEEEEEEEMRPEKILEEFDQNKDGKLTLVELTAELDEEDKNQEHDIPKIFAVADHDKDGMLDLGELNVVMDQLRKKQEADREEQEHDKPDEVQILGDFDKDNDGKLSLTELIGNLDEDQKMRTNDIEAVFAMTDVDKDNKLDLQELKAAIQELDKRDI